MLSPRAQNEGAVGPQPPFVLAQDQLPIFELVFLVKGSVNVRLPKVGEPKLEKGQMTPTMKIGA